MKDQDVKIEVTDWGLLVTVKQDFELNDANVFSSIEFVSEKLKKHGKHKIILDWTLANRKVSFINKYQGVEHLKKLTLFSGCYNLALVIPKQDDHENLKFVENVAYNNAIQISFFYDMALALEWILK